MRKYLIAGLLAAALLPAQAMAQVAFEGTWKADPSTTVSYKIDGDAVTMTTPAGQSYTAKVDGTDAPYVGDPNVTSVSLMKTSDNTLVESDKRDGETVSVHTMKITPDGKTIAISVRDKVSGTMTKLVAVRQ
jgi:endonuclease YncB( thermonuclease family)